MEFDYDKLAEKLFEKFNTKKEEKALEKFCEEYLGFVKRNRSTKTYEGAKLVCNKLLSFFPASRAIGTITQKDFENWLDFEKRTAPKAYRNYYRIARAMLNKAKEWGDVNENPLNRIRLPKKQTIKPAFITEDELQLICSYITIDVVRDAVMFGFYSGCRLGEIINLTWKDVNQREKILVIGNENFLTKARKQRDIPITPKLEEILARRFPKVIKTGKHFVFSKKNGTGFTTNYISKKFKEACKRAKVDPAIHFHSLRHSFASNLVRKNVNLLYIKDLLGHSSLAMVQVYSHSRVEELREAVERL